MFGLPVRAKALQRAITSSANRDWSGVSGAKMVPRSNWYATSLRRCEPAGHFGSSSPPYQGAFPANSNEDVGIRHESNRLVSAAGTDQSAAVRAFGRARRADLD